MYIYAKKLSSQLACATAHPLIQMSAKHNHVWPLIQYESSNVTHQHFALRANWYNESWTPEQTIIKFKLKVTEVLKHKDGCSTN